MNYFVDKARPWNNTEKLAQHSQTRSKHSIGNIGMRQKKNFNAATKRGETIVCPSSI
jgi:hypothetical protein